MKRKTVIMLIYASASACLAAVADAASESKSSTVEKRIEIHTTASGPDMRPMPPAEPVTFLGLEVDPVDATLAAQLKLPADHGLVVRFVVPDSPAAAAGVQKHDVLVKLDDQLLIAPKQLSALVRSRKEGDAIKLTYLRAGAESRATATLTKRVPPAVAGTRAFHWFGDDAVPGMPAHRPFIFRSDNGVAAGGLDEDRLIFAPHAASGPPVMIFRPKARILYKEGDITLEVVTDERGRQLEARGADGAVIFSGPINTPEQRAAVPADLQKHLEKLDALEPFDVPVPAPTPSTAPFPAPAPTATLEAAQPPGGADVPIGASTGAGNAAEVDDAVLRHATAI